MAVSCKSHILLMIIVTAWQARSIASAARPLNCIVPLPTSSDPKPASASNLALPRCGNTVEIVVIPADCATEFGKAVSGEETGSRLSFSSTASGRRGRSRTFGPMFLNFLPRGGPVPSSGPSKGTNSLNN